MPTVWFPNKTKALDIFYSNFISEILFRISKIYFIPNPINRILYGNSITFHVKCISGFVECRWDEFKIYYLANSERIDIDTPILSIYHPWWSFELRFTLIWWLAVWLTIAIIHCKHILKTSSDLIIYLWTSILNFIFYLLERSHHVPCLDKDIRFFVLILTLEHLKRVYSLEWNYNSVSNSNTESNLI